MINSELLKILASDKAARKKVEETAGAASGTDEKLAKDAEEFEKIFSEKSLNDVAEKKKENALILENTEAAYARRLADTQKAIDRLYSEHKDEWVDYLVQKVIGEKA